jgi:hypothetical protein
MSANTLLCNTSQVSSELQLVDTLVLGLTVHDTLTVLALAVTTADAHAVDDVPLLGLVTKTMSLLGTSGLVATYHLGALTVLPCANTKKETECITLLVTPKLFHILVSSHIDKLATRKRKL